MNSGRTREDNRNVRACCCCCCCCCCWSGAGSALGQQDGRHLWVNTENARSTRWCSRVCGVKLERSSSRSSSSNSSSRRGDMPATTTADAHDLNAGLTLCLAPARRTVTSDAGAQPLPPPPPPPPPSFPFFFFLPPLAFLSLTFRVFTPAPAPHPFPCASSGGMGLHASNEMGF